MYSVAIPRQFKEKTVTSAFLLSHSSTLYNALSNYCFIFWEESRNTTNKIPYISYSPFYLAKTIEIAEDGETAEAYIHVFGEGIIICVDMRL